MTEPDSIRLVELEHTAKDNERRISGLENDVKEIKNDQKAIYKIATSVELIAQRVGNIEEKVEDTNKKVDEQAAAWKNTEERLRDKTSQIELQPYQQTSANVNSLKMGIISAICSIIVSGIIAGLITFTK